MFRIRFSSFFFLCHAKPCLVLVCSSNELRLMRETTQIYSNEVVKVKFFQTHDVSHMNVEMIKIIKTSSHQRCTKDMGCFGAFSYS